MTMQGRLMIFIFFVTNTFTIYRVNLPSGEGDVSDSNSSEELESVIESEPDQHIDFVSLGSN